ncbi:hypothetical protein ABPG75_006765 [Micractinium tetrahymenae]
MQQQPTGQAQLSAPSAAQPARCWSFDVKDEQGEGKETIYGNEADVGRALADSGLRREEVWTSNWGYDKAWASIKQSLAELGTSYADLVLLHAPGDAATRGEAWRALEDAVQQGLVRSIGVSNFGIPHLQKLQQTATIKPTVNQIEIHPWLQWRQEVEYCRKEGIVLEVRQP